MANELLNLLIVDDDATLAASIKLMAPSNFKVYTATQSALIPDHVFFHAALVDMYIENQPPLKPDGPMIIQKLFKKNSQIEIISMSGDLNRENMESAIKAGATRFLAKPLNPAEIILMLEKISALWELRRSDLFSNRKTQLVGSSHYVEDLRKTLANLKGERNHILIEGETGSGKEVVSRILAEQEPLKPFVSVNCAAIPENLFESEFFGHIKGAFTGAEQNKTGLAEAAHGGSLFLDEIEALPLTQQAKLLRVLESGEIKKVGAHQTTVVDLRIISASNEPLTKLVEEKKFREDLYFRISSHKIEIPPLRKRKEDIQLLTEFFIQNDKIKRHKKFDESALQALKKYDWPGNIRELKRICEQLLLVSPLPFIQEIDVEKLIFNAQPTQEELPIDINQTLESFLQKQEKLFLEHAMIHLKSIDLVAEKLKISKSTLYKKLKEHGLQND